MKAIFMGTPDFAIPPLKAMIDDPMIDVVLVVSKEDKPKGRGKKVTFTPTKQLAYDNDIEVFTPKRIKDSESVEYLKSFEPDVIVVVAYGQILSKEILDIPKHGCINIHASILPQYRGPAPIHRAIMDGHKQTGVSIMYMDEGLDTGDIISRKRVEISEDETTGELYDKLKIEGARLIINTLNNIDNGIINRIPQDDSMATYAPLIEKAKCEISFEKDAHEIKNFVRGLLPFPKAYTYMNGVLFKFTKVDICDKNYDKKECGTVLDVLKDALVVQANDRAILVTRIQKEGSKELDVAEFLKGHKINVGDRFTHL